MNDLLKKQIEQYFGSIEKIPDEILPFVSTINHTYNNFEAEKALLQLTLKQHSDKFDNVKHHYFSIGKTEKAIVSKLKSSLSTVLSITPDKYRKHLKGEEDILDIVTILEKQLRKIKEYEENLILIKHFIDKSTDAIEVVDMSGRLFFINQRGATLLEDTVDNLVGKYIFDIDSKVLNEDSWQRTVSLFEHNEQLTFTRLHKYKNDSSLLMEIVLNKIEVNSKSYVIAVSRSISERKKAEKEREILVEKLREMNKELEDFAYIISHDLKAPLRGISTLASWLSEDHLDNLDKEGKEMIQLLNRRVRRMYSLIDGVLMYSRVGRAQKRNKLLDINNIVSEIIDSLEVPTGFEMTIEGELPLITNDETQIRQVFQNFISNAIKYNDKGENGRIIVSSKDLWSHWQFCIADNGPGIPAKYHDKIFQIFQTLHRRDDFESTGIGLTIVSKIIKNNAGEIWIKSEEGQGTRFYFTIKK